MKNNNNNLFFQLIRKFVFSKFFEHNRSFHGLRKRESRTLYRRRRREKKRKEGKKRKQQAARGLQTNICTCNGISKSQVERTCRDSWIYPVS